MSQATGKNLHIVSTTLTQHRLNNLHCADVVIVGGGPATLGLLCNAAKTNR